ncbi:MAG: aminomethyl-transferring glycine dehydrogenase [Massilibacteroides sp.]|nr:aminomethyl-transferring glycine dehydrogenase [Massilibacteroides sp.]
MNTNNFAARHIGITAADKVEMLKTIGVASIDELMNKTIPSNIRLKKQLNLPEAMTERELTEHLHALAAQNKIFTSYIGQGWYDTVCPAPIQRNVLENPIWYTSYTPYQAEVSQGRLEALINFQTVVSDLTGLPLANCSLLDEATAAAEAANLFLNARSREQVKMGANQLFVDRGVFESTQAVIHTRMHHRNVELIIGDYKTFVFNENVFGAIIQYPNADGNIEDFKDFMARAQATNTKVAVAADILSLVLLTPPGEWGADVVFGSTQRLGIPMYFGGPSAAFFATKDSYKRTIPGRIIGISKDRNEHEAYRLALQTREQHIKRERATSNICTAQALLASMASFYAVYHGPEGLRDIAGRIHSYTGYVAEQLTELGYTQLNKNYFDTLKITLPAKVKIKVLRQLALENQMNFHYFNDGAIGISLDETTQLKDLDTLIKVFAQAISKEVTSLTHEINRNCYFDSAFTRTSDFLQHEVFKKYHSETELMRYITRLGHRDISLAQSMIPLGSCTMKLNPASTLFPLSFPEFQNIHPYAPKDQTLGYIKMLKALEDMLSEITGMAQTSLQPNSGAAGEYTGLLTIRTYLESIGQEKRNIVLLPESAHGTNPASTVQCGFTPVIVKCDAQGNIDLEDFRKKAETYKDTLAASMITYPSTHGIFEQAIKEMCEIIHANGGQLYMDGANMNGQIGLTNPGIIGADICHLNLHKSFASPHGGGGPGIGSISAASHLTPFLPKHPIYWDNPRNTVAAAPFGNAGIACVTYAYIRLMGAEGLKQATETAILSSNYMAEKMKSTYGIVYTGATGYVGHELILDCRSLKNESGIDENDISKRLMDFGFHAPTLSFPVHGTLMIEPTESESKAEIDRFLQTLLTIWDEIKEIENGNVDPTDNVLKNAPHPQYEVTADNWTHSYTRSKAAFPLEWLQENKFWVNVARVDNATGDRNLIAKR